MEALWQGLSRDESELPSPERHGEVLEERDRKIAGGEESFVDWAVAKKKLREELQCNPSVTAGEALACSRLATSDHSKPVENQRSARHD